MLISLVFVAAAAQLIGGLAYVRDTLRGRTKPNRVSWALWGAAPIAGVLIALLEGNTSWALLPVFMAGFVPVLVLLSSYFNEHAYWHLDRFDYVCGGFGVISLVMWLWASQPVVAVVMLVLTDGLAAVPTIRKAWSSPETETSAAYFAALFGGTAALVNVQQWTVLQYAFPVYLVLINAVLLYAILGRRALMGSKPSGMDKC